ncbi:glycoside hydrolase family 61 protein [Desarmillaria tabescens]|uniref:lytic cellulose monooxygenase (C4-dehydrogenating) n=1 Tax=Armillaria tabescens TaxID=1929756 RepID=A0AA39JK26_ARMTA|nr:glycoside hydrolase family 61 protein [Desarmillaria tabescens]KAK0444202.1 glycoside hydrolase family 61 protein [Desarmillaria tabescens]
MKPSFFLPFLAASYVAAHGYVQKVTIDGTEYTGPAVGSGSTDGITREVSTQDPIKGATNSDLTCGPGALAASKVADANPGSSISFLWTGASGSPWPHNVGPMMTYMTNCGDQSSADYDPTGTEWFKIEEAGRTSNGTWAQAALMNGVAAEVTIPSNLAAGNYLIRHEIIALQNGQAEGGAEFYASCTQLKVGGSGTGTPPSSDLVQLPGAYSDTDPGILVDVYSNTNAAYTFPGPAVVDLGGSGSSAASSATSTNGHSSSAIPTAVSSTTSTRKHSSSAVPASDGSSSVVPKRSCKLEKPAITNDTLTKRETRPRHISRIMRGLNIFSRRH